MDKSVLPDEITSSPNWVIWRREQNDGGKWTKRPYQARFPRAKAESDNSKTWTTFEQATEAAGHADGIGFMAGVEPSGFILLDLDHCFAAADSYTEISPSKCGLHIFIGGVLPGPAVKTLQERLSTRNGPGTGAGHE